MEANEIRIGNYVNLYDDFNAQVTGMTNTGDVWCVDNPKNKECAWVISNIKPIPLTEEWLLKFGFKKQRYLNLLDKSYVLGILEFEFLKDNKIEVSITNGFDNTFIDVDCSNVHQLQNLYHALTGNELTTK